MAPNYQKEIAIPGLIKSLLAFFCAIFVAVNLPAILTNSPSRLSVTISFIICWANVYITQDAVIRLYGDWKYHKPNGKPSNLLSDPLPWLLAHGSVILIFVAGFLGVAQKENLKNWIALIAYLTFIGLMVLYFLRLKKIFEAK